MGSRYDSSAVNADSAGSRFNVQTSPLEESRDLQISVGKGSIWVKGLLKTVMIE